MQYPSLDGCSTPTRLQIYSQIRHLSVSAQLVMFTEAWTVAANPFLCGVKGKYSTLTCGSGTGGQMEAYAILSWLSVNASLSYLLRGQLR